MTQSAKKPFERDLFSPRLLQKPAMIRVIRGFNRVQLSKHAALKVRPLTFERRKETRALADKNVLPALFLRCENFLRARQIIQKRLRANHVFTSFQRLNDVL